MLHRHDNASAATNAKNATSLPAVPVLQQQPVIQNNTNNTQNNADQTDKLVQTETGIESTVVHSFSGTPHPAVIQAAGWTHDELVEKIREEVPAGMCNALTAAFLANKLEADETDDTTGVNEDNWEVIKSLKEFLDTSQMKLQYQGVESRDVSEAFQSYVALKGGAWFMSLPEKNIDAEATDFRRWYMARDGYQPPQKAVEKKCKGRYNQLSADKIGETVIDALEDHFTLGTAFDGYITITAEKANGSSVGHQFAVKHIPSEDYSSNKFQIFDQSLGLVSTVISTDDEIVDFLTSHLRKYVTHPLPNTVSAEFAVMLVFK